MKTIKQEQTEAREELRQMLPPGSRVYTTLRHVSRSGMLRTIDCHSITDNSPYWLSGMIARATGMGCDHKRQGIKMSGCGMDMGFALVYELSQVLYPSGFECIGERCPSNDHSNGDRDFSPHHHASGGYALRQRWL